MQKELTIACDIDGTLIDKNGKLDPDVYSLFTKANLDKTKVVLTTSCSYSQVAGTVKQINKILGNKEIKPYIATSCGSTIYNPDGDKIFHNNLNKDFTKEYVDIVKSIDPDAIIVYRSNEQNFVMNEPHSMVSKMIFGIYKMKESIKQVKYKTGMDFKDVEGEHKDFIEEHDLQNLFVVSLKKPLKKAIFAELTELSQKYGNKHQVYNGFAIQTPAVSKEEGLAKITNNLQDVIYFGDGRNDAKMLETAKYGFARGEKAKKLAVQKARYHYKNLNMVAAAMYGEEEHFINNMECLPSTDVITKDKIQSLPKRKHKTRDKIYNSIKGMLTSAKVDKNLKEYLERKKLGLDPLSNYKERASVEKIAEENQLLQNMVEKEEAEKQAKLHIEEPTK